MEKMDEFTYDTVPDNYREKYEKCQKNRIDAFVIVAGYGVLLIAVMLQAVGVLAGWRPVLAMMALAAAAEAVVLGIVRLCYHSSGKKLAALIRSREQSSLVGTFYPDYLFVAYGDDRKESISYSDITAVRETEAYFDICSGAAGLRLDKKYLGRDGILCLRNKMKKHCPHKYTCGLLPEDETLCIEIGWSEGDREQAVECASMYMLYRLRYYYSEKRAGFASVLAAAVFFMNISNPMLTVTVCMCLIVGVSMLIMLVRWLVFWLTLKATKKNYANRPQDAKTIVELSAEELVIHTYNRVIGLPLDKLESVTEGERFFAVNDQFIFKGDMSGEEQSVLRGRLKKYCREGFRYIDAADPVRNQQIRSAVSFVVQLLFIILIILNYHAHPLRTGESFKSGTAPEERQGTSEEKTDGVPAVPYVDTPDKDALHLGSRELRIEDCYCDNAVNLSSRFYIENGILYGISANEHGELGRGDTKGHINARGYYPPYEIADGVKHVALGKYFMLFINEENELWGTGDIPGTEGKMKVTKLMDHVRFAACTEEAMAVLKEDGTVWCGGTVKDLSGAGIVSYNGLEQTLSHMKYVTAGQNTLAAISDDNVLWTWGDNSYGQCGLPAAKEKVLAEPVQVREKVKSVWADALLYDSPEQYPLYDRKEPLSYVRHQTYIQQTDGEVYACGENLASGGEDVFVRVMLQQTDVR